MCELIIHVYHYAYYNMYVYNTLQSKVRSTYNSLNLDFKIDERFLSPTNQRVTEALIDQIYNECGGIYSVKDIKRKYIWMHS